MQIVITGGSGFLGQRLASALISSAVPFEELILADIALPGAPGNDARIRCLQLDLSEPGAIDCLINDRTHTVFHLAAIVSSHAEKDFDLGWRVNVDITRQILEACRQKKQDIRFVFASSLAVYGGKLPSLVDDHTALMPQSSYGAQKATAELLVHDYSRKKFVDGRILRLPTICIRPGRPNQAASSFVSSIMREPLNGEPAICPVPLQLGLWLSSPETVTRNILHGADLDPSAFGFSRTVNLPGIGVTVKQMLDALERLTGKETLARVNFRHDPVIDRIVSSWPSAIDNTRALAMGFSVDATFDDFILQFKNSSNHVTG
jgi:nucleoside-diphosphate-sugar epimerase